MSAWLDAQTPGGYGDALTQVPPTAAPGSSWADIVGATFNRGLNRWIDVEAYNRTGGALTPQVWNGSAAPPLTPGQQPPVIKPDGVGGAVSGAMPYLPLIVGGVVVLLILSRLGK